ncbi:dihydrofolate reductase family protein [Nocardia thailandica]|uniref:dihydrofolate reductase family protein n=1 Tax=Nocardia thailandica TaxID=257275 RepID=UPI0005BC2CC2|nr:dihydrofolate reductase family protein [Nocardia thailandica]
MSKIVVYMSMSLDGYIAAQDDGPGRGLGAGGEPLHAWLTDGSVSPGSFRPEHGVNAEIFDEMMAAGAVITGRHTFEWAGEWGGDHHDGVPIFVLTRREPEQAVRGLAHYVADPESAVAQAKEAAGDRDVMVHGGSSVQALLRAGLIDEMVIHLVPILLGRGRRLFDEPARTSRLRLIRSVEGAGVLHLRYQVEPPADEPPLRR